MQARKSPESQTLAVLSCTHQHLERALCCLSCKQQHLAFRWCLVWEIFIVILMTRFEVCPWSRVCSRLGNTLVEIHGLQYCLHPDVASEMPLINPGQVTLLCLQSLMLTIVFIKFTHQEPACGIACPSSQTACSCTAARHAVLCMCFLSRGSLVPERSSPLQKLSLVPCHQTASA